MRATAAELRKAFGELFDRRLSKEEWRRRRDEWVAALREAWPDLTEGQRWELADMRSTLHLVGE